MLLSTRMNISWTTCHQMVIYSCLGLLDLRNEDRNQKFYRIGNQDTNFHLNIDSIGRATFSNEFALYDPDHLDHDIAINICEQKHNSNEGEPFLP